MKRIINGVTYNTETAAVVARYDYTDADGWETEATVYQTRGGALFQVHVWDEEAKDARGDWQKKRKVLFEPMNRAALVKLIAETNGLEIVDNSVLEDPPEATAETKPEAIIYVRVPVALKQRLDEEARSEDQSTNAFAIRCIEHCLQRDEGLTKLVGAWRDLKTLELTPEAFTREGAMAIAASALEYVEGAAKAFGFTERDIANVEVWDQENWRSNKHDDLHTPEWRGRE